MPRGNRVLMLRDLYRSEVEDEEGRIRKTGYVQGRVYNFPTHLARALVKKHTYLGATIKENYAEFYHAPKTSS